MGAAVKQMDGVLSNDLKALGINADQWTTADQNDAERCKAAEQGANNFMAK